MASETRSILEGTVTIYILGGQLAVDCDKCHAGLLDSPTIGIGSDWLASAMAAHAPICPGSPFAPATPKGS